MAQRDPATPTRAQRRAAIETQVLTSGREHLRTQGAAALSLRSIARELGMVSSAIYRYVDSRDELITRLLIEAYDDLADTVIADLDAAADDSSLPDHPRHRSEILARSFRRWAVRDPSRYALLYGSPVPGYDAPAERTTGPGTRVIVVALTEVAKAGAAGDLLPDDRPVAGELAASLTAIRDEYGLPLTDGQLVRAITWWTGMVGAVSQEVFGVLGTDTFGDPEALYEEQIRLLLDQLYAPTTG